ncbi:MAG: hypothetical protein LBI45_05355 [Bacteroidales bacterium]|jgi:hypothetical protein|nr:hypothetical protein [Bacteroidales bacterium]
MKKNHFEVQMQVPVTFSIPEPKVTVYRGVTSFLFDSQEQFDDWIASNGKQVKDGDLILFRDETPEMYRDGENFVKFKGGKGEDGKNGEDGKDGKNGKDGENGKNGENGAQGKSAYESAITGGYTGSETEFNTSLASIGDINTVLTTIIG